MIRFLVMCLLLYIGYRIVISMVAGKKTPDTPTKNHDAGEETHRDPVCGVYVSEGSAIIGRHDGQRHCDLHQQRTADGARLAGSYCDVQYDDRSEHAADAALLQYHVDLAGGLRDVNSAAAIGLKLTGAQEFLTVFKLLAEQPPRAPAPPARDTLDANA